MDDQTMYQVVCVTADPDLPVTTHKVYNIVGSVKTHYQIYGDHGKLIWVFREDFLEF